MVSMRTVISAGILTFVCGLVALFPATVAVRYFVPEVVSVSGLRGTVWNGSAAAVSIEDVYLRDIEWQLKPLSLFTGKAAYAIEATPASGLFDAEASISLGGTIVLSKLNAAIPLSYMANAIGVPGLQGNASLTFERIEIVDGFATSADGVLQLANVVVPVIGRESLGGYEAEFFTQSGGISASVKDTDGVVDLAGSLEIAADRSYVFIAQVIGKSTTPQSVLRQLQFLPPANERGQQEIRLEGVF